MPLIATGHLFTHGSTVSDSERSIHVGNLGDVSANVFDDVFDYVALGHLHGKQAVSDKVHYSGSLLNMSFTKSVRKKSVNMIDFSQKPALISAETLPLPTALVRLKGTKEEIVAKIQQYQFEAETSMVWVDACVSNDNGVDLRALFNQACEHKAIEVLKITLDKPVNSIDSSIDTRQLRDIKPEEMFLKRCQSKQVSTERQTELLNLFHQLYEQIAKE